MALLMALTASAEAVSPIKAFKKACEAQMAGSTVRKVAAEAKMPLKVSEMALKFKPTVTKTYGWNGKKWILDDNITYVYDAKGNVASESSVDADRSYANTTYEYDANGKVIFKETKVSANGKDYQNYKKTEFAYDPILTNVITMRTEWLWMDMGKGYEWQLVGNNYKRIIDRNDDGNITSIVIAVLFQGIYDPTQRIDITYGDDGKATSISEQLLNYDGKEYFWEQGLKITDIVWENTDGQIYDPEDLFNGNNRLKSAHYEDTDDMSFDMNVEYAADSEAYTATMKMVMEEDEMGPFEMTGITAYTPLENDGYVVDSATYFMGYEVFKGKEELRYDDWGYMTLQYYEEMEDDDIYYEKTIGEVEFDADGFPTSYTVSEEYIDARGAVVNEKAFRAEYSDYVDVTASVSALEAVDVEVRYYNLQGVPVERPSAGMILIKRQGEKAEKIKY